MADEEALKINAAEEERNANSEWYRMSKVLPAKIVKRGSAIVEERELYATLEPANVNLTKYTNAANRLGAESNMNNTRENGLGTPELNYAAGLGYKNAALAYRITFNTGTGEQRVPRLKTAIEFNKLAIAHFKKAEEAAPRWEQNTAAAAEEAGMKRPGPPLEFLNPNDVAAKAKAEANAKAADVAREGEEAKAMSLNGGRRRTRRRMKNPCWKGYKAYGMKRTRKGKVPNCVPRKTRRRHK